MQLQVTRLGHVAGQAEEKANVCVALVHGTDYEDNNDSQAQSGELVYTGQGGNDLLHSRQQVSQYPLQPSLCSWWFGVVLR